MFFWPSTGIENYGRRRAMPTAELVHHWSRKNPELRPGERIRRIRNLAWLLACTEAARSIGARPLRRDLVQRFCRA